MDNSIHFSTLGCRVTKSPILLMLTEKINVHEKQPCKAMSDSRLKHDRPLGFKDKNSPKEKGKEQRIKMCKIKKISCQETLS